MATYYIDTELGNDSYNGTLMVYTTGLNGPCKTWAGLYPKINFATISATTVNIKYPSTATPLGEGTDDFYFNFYDNGNYSVVGLARYTISSSITIQPYNYTTTGGALGNGKIPISSLSGFFNIPYTNGVCMVFGNGYQTLTLKHFVYTSSTATDLVAVDGPVPGSGPSPIDYSGCILYLTDVDLSTTASNSCVFNYSPLVYNAAAYRRIAVTSNCTFSSTYKFFREPYTGGSFVMGGTGSNISITTGQRTDEVLKDLYTLELNNITISCNATPTGIEDIYQAFSSRLATEGTNTPYDATNGRIYKSIGAADSLLPMIVWTVVSNPQTDNFSTGTVDLSIQIDVYNAQSVGDTAVSVINDAVYALLNNHILEVNGFNCSPIKCTKRGIFTDEDNYLRCRSEYTWKVTA